MSTAQRLNQLMDWVRSDRSRTNLESAAELTGYSRFHLHRLFKEHTGETLQEFSHRNRLARAAQLLRHPRQSILRVALECGFSSAEDFSRSFRRYFGLTPREAGRGARISVNQPAPGRPVETRWPVYLQKMPDLEIYYTRIFRAMSNPQRVQQALRQLYDCSTGPLIGLCWDDMDVSPLSHFIYDAGIVENRSWLNRLHLPARTYVVMDFQGDLGEEAEAFEYLRHSWLPRHNCRPAAGPSLEIFVDERSLEDWDRLNLKLCIPLSE